MVASIHKIANGGQNNNQTDEFDISTVLVILSNLGYVLVRLHGYITRISIYVS